jgi:hypothetical protein
MVVTGNPTAPNPADHGGLSFYYGIGNGGTMWYTRSVNPRDPSEWTEPQLIFQNGYNDLGSAGSLGVDEDGGLYYAFAQWDSLYFDITDEETGAMGFYTNENAPVQLKMAYWHPDYDWWAPEAEVLYEALVDTAAGQFGKIHNVTAPAMVVGPSSGLGEDSWGYDMAYSVAYGDAGAIAAPFDIHYAKGPYQPTWLYGSSVEPEQNSVAVPAVASLNQNYPNPFNPKTTIRYDVTVAGQLNLAIYNTKGELVKTLVNSKVTAGSYAVTWDGTNSNNQAVPSGMYTYRLQTGDQAMTKSMVLLK